VAISREAAASISKLDPLESSAQAPIQSKEPEASKAGATPNGATPNGVPPNGSGESSSPHEPLTPRELELLRYMAEGYTNKEVARAMVLAEDTVKKGVQMLIAKLGAADRTHAVVLALRNHLIE
jgi:DNA-binding NarL/FixJ family response regulator